MKKEIFRVGDKVYDATYGWGTITSINYAVFLPITVKFDRDKVSYTKDGQIYPWAIRPTLSFQEYGFDDRFSLKRPTSYTEYIGKWGKFWDNPDNVIIDRLYNISNYCDTIEFVPHIDASISLYMQHKSYSNFEPLTDKQIKTLGLK